MSDRSADPPNGDDAGATSTRLRSPSQADTRLQTTGTRLHTAGSGATTAPPSALRGPSAAATAHGARPGMVVKNRFLLEEKIGEGGMGVVFKARDVRNEKYGEWVAIKFLGAHLQDDADALEALQHEVRRAHELAHPNVVTIYDFDQDGALSYIYMDLLEGGSTGCCAGSGPTGCRSRKLGRSSKAPARRSRTRTARVSSMPTSSPATCSSRATTASRCSTSRSRARSGKTPTSSTRPCSAASRPRTRARRWRCTSSRTRATTCTASRASRTSCSAAAIRSTASPRISRNTRICRPRRSRACRAPRCGRSHAAYRSRGARARRPWRRFSTTSGSRPCVGVASPAHGRGAAVAAAAMGVVYWYSSEALRRTTRSFSRPWPRAARRSTAAPTRAIASRCSSRDRSTSRAPLPGSIRRCCRKVRPPTRSTRSRACSGSTPRTPLRAPASCGSSTSTRRARRSSSSRAIRRARRKWPGTAWSSTAQLQPKSRGEGKRAPR